MLEQKTAALRTERNRLIAAVGEHVTVRAEYQEQIEALRAKVGELEEKLKSAFAQARNDGYETGRASLQAAQEHDSAMVDAVERWQRINARKDEALERGRRWANNRGYHEVAEDLARAIALTQPPPEAAQPGTFTLTVCATPGCGRPEGHAGDCQPAPSAGSAQDGEVR